MDLDRRGVVTRPSAGDARAGRELARLAVEETPGRVDDKTTRTASGHETLGPEDLEVQAVTAPAA
jgi:hypothetical protein